MDEKWLPVVGYAGRYEVSNVGRVRSVDRIVIRSNPYRECLQRGRVLRPATRKSGHLHVALSHSGIATTHLVHHLVLRAFVGPCPDGLEACHGDGNPANNELSNLRWDSRSANVLDSVNHGTHNRASRTHCSRLHPLTEDNTYRSASRPNARTCKTCAKDRARRSRANRIGRTAA